MAKAHRYFIGAGCLLIVFGLVIFFTAAMIIFVLCFSLQPFTVT